MLAYRLFFLNPFGFFRQNKK